MRRIFLDSNSSPNKYHKALPNGWNSQAFVSSLRVIYDWTPESDRKLWDVTVSFAGSKATELMDRGKFVELCNENGEICFEILKKSLDLSTKTLLTFINAAGCPWFGPEHCMDVVRGRQAGKYFCTTC